MIETILEEIRGLNNLPLFRRTELGAWKAHDMELCAGQSVQRHLFRYEGVYRDGAWLFRRSGTLEARREDLRSVSEKAAGAL